MKYLFHTSNHLNDSGGHVCSRRSPFGVKLDKFHFHFSLLCLTWVCCCKRNAVLSVERGFILREETKFDDKQTLAGELRRHGWLSPWSSLDRCLELHYWQLQRHGLDPNRSIATPLVSEASVWRPWSRRQRKASVTFQTCKTKKARSYRQFTPAAGSIQENSFYSLDQLIHMCFPFFFPRVFQDRTCQLWIQKTLSRHCSATELKATMKMCPIKTWNLEQFDGADEICINRTVEQSVH